MGTCPPLCTCGLTAGTEVQPRKVPQARPCPAHKAHAAMSYTVPGTCRLFGWFVAASSSGGPGWAPGPSARTCGSPVLHAFST